MVRTYGDLTVNTSKETGNRQEDRSSQEEAMKRPMGLSIPRVVDAHRETGINDGERRLFDTSSALTSGVGVWTAEIETVIDIATLRRRLKSFEDRSLLRICERAQLLAFARLQSLLV